MRTKEDELIFDAFNKSLAGNKTYEELVQDAVAMERLQNVPEFEVLRKLLAEAYAMLVSRVSLANRDDLPVIQGALRQHELLMRLPQKVVETAQRIVAQRREEAQVEST